MSMEARRDGPGRPFDHPKYWAVILAAVVGILVTGGAVWGAVYKVKAPISYTPWAALVIFLIGLVVAFLVPADMAAKHQLDGNQPVKL